MPKDLDHLVSDIVGFFLSSPDVATTVTKVIISSRDEISIQGTAGRSFVSIDTTADELTGYYLSCLSNASSLGFSFEQRERVWMMLGGTHMDECLAAVTEEVGLELRRSLHIGLDGPRWRE